MIPKTNLERWATYKAVLVSRAKYLSGDSLDQNPSLTGNQK